MQVQRPTSVYLYPILQQELALCYVITIGIKEMSCSNVHSILCSYTSPHTNITLTLVTTSNLTVSRAIEYLSDTVPHLAVSTFDLQFPISHASILRSFRVHIESIVGNKPSLDSQPLEGEMAHKRQIVAVIDSIASIPGALLPWVEMVSICREYGIWTLVDAAHSIGQEQNINLTEARPDFWISVSQISQSTVKILRLSQNCYKWLYTKRNCALLYVPRRYAFFL